MMQATDLSARLLATENITVIRANSRTASFDIKSRVLTLPMWKEMTPEIEDMLVGHEVGHALFTGDEYMKPIEENRKMMSYLNVLEDVRIEKLIKRQYPGMRKRMNEGYRQLNERDFFGVSKAPLESLLLIDKINLYFKAGYQCGVTFSMEEKLFVARAGQTESIDDVIQLAHDVYAFSKEQAEKRKQQMMQEEPEDSYEDSDEEPDGEFGEEGDIGDDYQDQDQDDINTDEYQQPKPDPSVVSDEELESKTDRAFANKLEDLADTDTEYNYHEFAPSYIDPIVGYKQVMQDTVPENDSVPEYVLRRLKLDEDVDVEVQMQKQFMEFKSSSQPTVNYLVKEFEMRKSAQLYKRAQTSKIGSLDMRKVWSYKLNEDLFKRVTTVPQGKNHGMLFLLDWSGSMDHVIKDTLKQVINLAMFCNKAQIPYRVLAFTTQYKNTEKEMQIIYDGRRATMASEKSLLDTCDGFRLLELMSSRMSMSEFNTMTKRLLDDRFTWNDGYSMGGTPLNEALVWVYQNLDSYLKANAIEKMSLITLTDGCGGSLSVHKGNLSDASVTYEGDQRKYVKKKHFIRDEKTKKTYQITKESTQQTETILRMIKDRYQIKIVGFYICRNNRRELMSALRDNVDGFAGDYYTTVDGWRKSFRDKGFASVTGTGRDDLFIIPLSSTKIQEGELNVDSDMKANALARNFTKFLNVKKTSRILLNTFVGYVA